jgi:hypothetical protein
MGEVLEAKGAERLNLRLLPVSKHSSYTTVVAVRSNDRASCRRQREFKEQRLSLLS